MENYEISPRPTIQPPIPSNNQFQQPLSNQVNGPFPFPQRQRSSELQQEEIDLKLTQFLKAMEEQFRDKHQRDDEKLDGMCEDRFFCEMALLGRQPNADALHRMLYNVALE